MNSVSYERGKDADTGWEYTLMAVDGEDLVIPYFHREMWSRDERWLLCEGRGKTLLCDWRGEKTEVLQDMWQGDVTKACFARRDDHIWFVRGKAIWKGEIGGRTGLARIRVYDMSPLMWGE